MLCDDYDARVAATNHNVEAFSVHKLLHQTIKQRRITAVQAAGFADALALGRSGAGLHGGRPELAQISAQVGWLGDTFGLRQRSWSRVAGRGVGRM